MTTLRTLLCLFDFFRAGRRQPGFALGVFLTMAAMLAAAPLNFEIAAQPATSSLPLFITQSGAQVMYGHEEVAKVSTNAVTGAYEPKAALTLLFKGTGLNFSERGEGLFVVKTTNATESSRGTVRGTVVKPELGSSAGIRVLVRESGQQAVSDRRGDFVLANVEAGTYTLIASAEGLQTMHITDVTVRAGRELTLSRETMRKAGDVTELEPFVVRGRADEVTELDKYVVEGRKEKPFVGGNMDIPRTVNDVQPYYIFDAQTIDQSGAVNVEDFLKQQLTMNTSVQMNGAKGDLNLSGNTSSFDLRGLGADKTLILVNGRRMAGVTFRSGTDVAENQPDLNGLPLGSIERIEVLPSSASGIYGGSAIGGVINVILKRKYAGGEIRMSYDNTWDTDAPRRSASLSYGTSYFGGKTHLMVNASWADSISLILLERRELMDRGIATILANYPDFLYGSSNPFLGALPNISPINNNVTQLRFKDGTWLGSRNTYVPSGTSPSTSLATLQAGLLANAGQWNLELPNSTQPETGLLRPLGTAPRTRSFGGSVRHELWENLEVHADFSYQENQTESLYNAYSIYLTIPVASPANPFDTDVRVRFPSGNRMPLDTISTARSLTLGSIAKLPWDWTGQFDYTWSESRFESVYYSFDGPPRTADIANGTLNPFVDTLLHPLSLEKYNNANGQNSITKLHDFALRGSGPLGVLPWGTPQLTAGLEHRIAQRPQMIRESILPISTQDSYRQVYLPREQGTTSVYGETLFPLVKTGVWPLLHALELQASGRVERYTVDTGTPSYMVYFNHTPPEITYLAPTLNGEPFFSEASYTSTNHTVGLKYQPVSDVTVRASIATAFLPPTPAQLLKNGVPNASLSAITDRQTGERVSVETISGGNPDLKPQNSDSMNLGLIWAPRKSWLRGMRMNAEYYLIRQHDAIGSLSAQAIVDEEALYNDRVVRNSAGNIVLVDTSMINLFLRETEGLDFSVDYRRSTPWGTFTLRATESVILHLKTQYTKAQPLVDGVGFPSEAGAAKYKSNVSVNWEWEKWTAGWTVRYFSAYKQYGAAGGPNSVRYGNGQNYSTTIRAQGSDTIPSQVYHDVFVGYAFGNRASKQDARLKKAGNKLLDGLTIQLGVRNVLDKSPPFDANYANSFYTSPYGDARLRTYWLNVKKAF